MDPLLVRFYRQYMQQIANLTYPPPKLLLEPDVQDQIYKHFFDGPLRGPPAYQRRVLKQIISLIERAIANPDQDVSRAYGVFYLSLCDQMCSIPVTHQPSMLLTPR